MDQPKPQRRLAGRPEGGFSGDSPGHVSGGSTRPAATGKILLTTLWERTSAKGTVYLSGYLGKASIVAFRGEPTADGTPTWDVFVSPGKGAPSRPAAAGVLGALVAAAAPSY